MAFEVVSDRPLTGRDEFMVETMNILQETGARRIGVFAVLKSGETFCGYHEMGFGDKLLMSGVAQADAVDEMIRANWERYMETGEEDAE